MECKRGICMHHFAFIYYICRPITETDTNDFKRFSPCYENLKSGMSWKEWNERVRNWPKLNSKKHPDVLCKLFQKLKFAFYYFRINECIETVCVYMSAILGEPKAHQFIIFYNPIVFEASFYLEFSLSVLCVVFYLILGLKLKHLHRYSIIHLLNRLINWL